MGISITITNKRAAASSHAPTPKKTPSDKWALESVHDDLTLTKDRLITWFILDPQMWSFRSVAEGERLIRTHATHLAELVGRTIYGRITTRPYPVREWAQTAYENAPAPTNGYVKLLERDQAFLHGRAQADKLVYYGVDLGKRSMILGRLATMLPEAAKRELAALRAKIEEIRGIMARPGIEAVPATGDDIAWLLARSFALGCPIPSLPGSGDGQWTKTDLAEFTAGVHWDAEPLAQSVRVTHTRAERPVTRHVVVLTVGRMSDDLCIPEQDEPWIAKTDALRFPVEWSFRVDLRPPDETAKEMNKLTDRIVNQRNHYIEDHGKQPPKQLDRQFHHARAVEDETRKGFDGLSLRTKAWFRIAVAGCTEEEALKRAAEVEELYKPGIVIERTLDQYRLAREFVPGEPLANEGHTRHMPITKLAAGVPAATAEVGDRRGNVIALTAGHAERPVIWCPWFSPEVLEGSGLTVVTGGLGSGKTVLGTGIVYKTCMQGVPWSLLDPSGMLTALADLPEFHGVSRAVSLLDSEPGALNPYALINTPHRSWFDEEDNPELAWVRAVKAAEAERRDLVADTLAWCLAPEALDYPGVRMALKRAAWSAPAEVYSTIDGVISFLNLQGQGSSDRAEVARIIADGLLQARERELSRLFFADDTTGNHGESEQTPRLTIFSLKGLTPPPSGKDMADWTPNERLSRPIVNLAAHYTLRNVYRLDRHERKGALLDEVHEITAAGGSGQVLVQKGATDTRKHNFAMLALTQNASKILGQDISNLVGTVFCGKATGAAEQRANCELLGLPQDVGYEEVFGQLSMRSRRSTQTGTPREFIMRDSMGGDGGRGGMEKIRVDFSNHPDFLAAISSTADPTKRRAVRAAAQTAGVGA